ncbi:zinc ribbon domain-containing protein [Streptomyces sp. NPDC017991]|uniref:zinc ribbon domain-containing protein n=1 Tax=Streptomyces sp. NPDC017991 TaxID=3365026 RepID=UPI00379A2194
MSVYRTGALGLVGITGTIRPGAWQSDCSIQTISWYRCTAVSFRCISQQDRIDPETVVTQVVDHPLGLVRRRSIFEPTSLTCSTCGVGDGRKPLNVRERTCTACGAHDRGVNAAINVKTAAGPAMSACGAPVRPGVVPAQLPTELHAA